MHPQSGLVSFRPELGACDGLGPVGLGLRETACLADTTASVEGDSAWGEAWSVQVGSQVSCEHADDILVLR